MHWFRAIRLRRAYRAIAKLELMEPDLGWELRKEMLADTWQLIEASRANRKERKQLRREMIRGWK